MAKILTEDMLKEILDEASSSAYFFQKNIDKETNEERRKMYEEDGSVLVTILTEISQIQPDDEDLLGRTWKPKLKDSDGKPLIDSFSGRKREPWDKFEAKGIIKEKEIIYGFGGKGGILLKGFVAEMNKNELKNSDLPNTKWKVKNIGKWKWDITYLGKEEPKKKNGKKEEPSVYDAVADAIQNIKKTNVARAISGINKGDLVEAIGFKIEKEAKKILSVWDELIKNGVILEDNNKVYIQ